MEDMLRLDLLEIPLNRARHAKRVAIHALRFYDACVRYEQLGVDHPDYLEAVKEAIGAKNELFDTISAYERKED